MIMFIARTLPIVNEYEHARLSQMTLGTESKKKDGIRRSSVFDRFLADFPLGTNALALIAEHYVPGDLMPLSEEWVGWSLLWWQLGNGCNLGVYVKPAWRREGTGKLLVQKQVAIAMHLGLTPYANTGDEGAQKLFRACGVRPFTPEYER